MIYIILYHGTIDKYAYDILRNGIILEKSKPHLDFGPGFYTTPNKDFAINTARFHQYRYNMAHKPEHVGWRVVVLECDDSMFEQMSYKTFDEPDMIWGMFIITNRCKNQDVHDQYDNNLDKRYDVVRGATADGKGAMAPIIKAIDSGICALEDIDFSSFAPSSWHWGEQISFHTEKSLSCITLKGMLEYTRRR